MLPPQAQEHPSYMSRPVSQLQLAQQLYAARLEALLQQLQTKEHAFQYVILTYASVHSSARWTVSKVVRWMKS